MSQKIDDRIPREVGSKSLPVHPAVKTPWEKLISFHDAYHYACRHHAVIGAVFQEVLRILIPDYDERCTLMCAMDVGVKRYIFDKEKGMEVAPGVHYLEMHLANHFMHPFFEGTDNTGGFRAGVFGDNGDERLMMCGRVNEFGTYRVEKELDTCPWDIMGSEICRVSTASLEEIGKCCGDNCEYNMVEARGCGDLHCRVVCENRDKYPMPPREKNWDNFGPIATADQIKFTPREEMYSEPQQFRSEYDYTYRSGTCMEKDADGYYADGAVTYALGSDYVVNPLNTLIRQGKFTQEQVDNIITCVFEGAGKASFGERFAINGLHDWLGVPRGINDGRVLGGYIEVILQTVLCPYEVIAFNKDEVIYDINRKAFGRGLDMMTTAYNAYFYGMVKTLVGPEWSFWEETENVPEGIYRVKIAKKIDKFCR